MKKPAAGAIVRAIGGRTAIVRRVEWTHSYVEYLDGIQPNTGAFKHAEFWDYFKRAA